ncbi:PHP domain-containing protein [Streptomyces lydicus]|uniref:PHP domain-containing protein n=1 Tax=Streptomyces lydicus TaxID=47763 RepID=UPI0037B23545
MFAEVARQKMPDMAMSDHGNMLGAYEFQQWRRNVGGKSMIGIEACVVSSLRRSPKQEFWGQECPGAKLRSWHCIAIDLIRRRTVTANPSEGKV